MTRSELTRWVAERNEPGFRADQVWQWLWKRRAATFDEMTNVSKAFRKLMARSWSIRPPQIAKALASADGTVKLALALADGALVETVLIPDRGRVTQCISTQVGCPMACTFCSTGTMGLTRNMTAGEIAGQLLAGLAHLQASGRETEIRNVVVMGMGEPLLNWKATEPALETLHDPMGLGLSRRRITLSTCGVEDRIGQVARSRLAMLAISLHAPNQDLRERIMPVAAKALPLDRLMAELKAYPLEPRERITIEYLLLGGINDRLEHARGLVRLLNGLRCKINLIAYNPGPGLPYEPPTLQAVNAFADLLWGKGLTATVRKSKGLDIAAACGQLLIRPSNPHRKDA